MLKRFISNYSPRTIIATIIASTIFSACNSSHRYYDEAISATAEVHTRLVALGYCKDASDCQRKEIVKYEAAAGVYINVYGVTSKTLAEEFSRIVCSEHNRNIDIEYRLNVFFTAKDSDEPRTILIRKFSRGEQCH